MLFLVLAACLVNDALYEDRHAALTDYDGDGVPRSEDCDDEDASVPGGEEIPYDGKDNDCEGGDLVDVDGDGYDAQVAGGSDCDDEDASVHPGAAETWENGATDNDCDGNLGAATIEYGDEVWTGEAAGDRAGHRVATLGDVRGDTLAEFLASAPLTGEDEGTVYVIDGPDPGPLAQELRITGAEPGWLLGIGLDGGVDADADGLPDALVGAPGRDGARGAVWLLSGSALEAAVADLSIETSATWTATAMRRPATSAPRWPSSATSTATATPRSAPPPPPRVPAASRPTARPPSGSTCPAPAPLPTPT